LLSFPSVNKAAKLLKLGSVASVAVNVRPTSAGVMLVPTNKGAVVAGADEVTPGAAGAIANVGLNSVKYRLFLHLA
jgi:hypothetical protein